MEEYVRSRGRRRGASSTTLPPAVVVVSARSPERLREQMEQLLSALRRGRFAESDLADIAYTLQVGREPMEERLGLIVSSLGELEQRLQAFSDGDDCPGVYPGQAQNRDNRLTIQRSTN